MENYKRKFQMHDVMRVTTVKSEQKVKQQDGHGEEFSYIILMT